MEKAYSKRELDLKFKGSEDKNDAWNATILEKLEDLDKFRLSPTLEQARRTNGRVDKLERWRVWLTGGAVVFIPAFTAVSGWFVYTQLTIQEAIDNAVKERFDSIEYQYVSNPQYHE